MGIFGSREYDEEEKKTLLSQVVDQRCCIIEVGPHHKRVLPKNKWMRFVGSHAEAQPRIRDLFEMNHCQMVL